MCVCECVSVCLHVCSFVNAFQLRTCTAKYRHEWVMSRNTHTKGIHVSGGDLWGGGGAWIRGDQGVIDFCRDGEMCPSLWGESRRGKAACCRPFLCLMTRSWCLILAIQHGGLNVCTGKREVGRGRGDRVKKKKKLFNLRYSRCSRFVAGLKDFALQSLNITV